MRVTKLIREYVEKSVKAMSKFAEPTPEEVEYKALCDKLGTFRTSLDEQIKEIVTKVLEDKIFMIGSGGGVTLSATTSGGGCAGCSGGNCAHCHS